MAPAEAPLPSTGRRTAGREAVQALDLMIWAGERVALVAAMSPQASTRLQETLATNVLASIGERGPRVVGRIGWPVFNNLLVPGNGRDDLVELVRDLGEELTRHTMVVLGDAHSGAQEVLSDALGRPADVGFGHSLAELAGDPTLKRALWQQLKPLVVR